MLKNNKCILVYNLKDEELQKLKRLPFKVVEITKEMTNMTVKDIIEGLKIETSNENASEEKLILFNNFAQREMKNMISTTRKIVTGGILAVVTPISINWTVNYLANHLVLERETMSKGRR
ncbi:MAG: DUF3783 domain-containing protein [Clostridium sp.]|nr:DUF3783 domain-containing protein [Clostridium sp.]